MGERDGQRHELGRLVDGEAEHHPLVARAELVRIDALAGLERVVDALRDLGRLRLDGRDDAAGLVVESRGGIGVADVPDDITDEPLEIYVAVRRDLAEHEDGAGGRGRLARDARIRVLAQELVEDRVGHLVAELVGVALGDGLAREEHPVGGHEARGHG